MAPCALMRPNAPECILTHPHASRCIPKCILLQCIPGSPVHPQESEGIRMLALGPLQTRNSTSNCFSNTRRRVIVSTENYILGLTAVRAAKRNATTTTRIFRESTTKTEGWRPRPIIANKYRHVQKANYMLAFQQAWAPERRRAHTPQRPGLAPPAGSRKKLPPHRKSQLYAGFSACPGARAAQGPHATAPRAGTTDR